MELYVRTMYELFDEHLASATVWLWKEESQGSWGFFDHDATSGTFTERPLVVATASRPYVERVAGTPTRLRWDATAGTLTLGFEGGVDAPHVLIVPAPYAIASITCDGAGVSPTGSAPRYQVACRGPGPHTLVATLTR
jgi:hypothetical protein